MLPVGQIGHLTPQHVDRQTGPGVSIKRTMTNKLSLSVNAEAGDGKADGLIARWRNGVAFGDSWRGSSSAIWLTEC